MTAKSSDKKSLIKEDFLEELSRMSKDDIDKLIRDKGKQPKLICPFIMTECINKQ